MAKVYPEGMPQVAKVRDFLISNIKWVCGAVLLVVVSASIIVAIVLMLQPKPQGDNPKYTATCVLVDYTMWKPIQTRCKVSVPAEMEADINVSKTSFSLNSGESLPVNCSYQDMDRVITCQGPHVTCQIRGTLSIAFFDNDGKPVLDKTLLN
ncbi:hypothetical protein DPMN_138542 [Dreissena polymorpha]|uniref:Uncharacterized protein n=1 Tax=Dreissena polymorpha TaxID=45954 RepID=A0A9D4JES3_DREPO|nr:hypothetical protein DPMN_138542 [Dreissena polymorpha]